MRPPDLLEKLLAERASGELITTNGTEETHVYLQRGRLAWGTTTSDRFLFRRYLCQVFGLDADELAVLVDECFRLRKPLGEHLVAQNILTRAQVREALAAQTRSALAAFLTSTGPCIFLARAEQYAHYDSSLTFAREELESAAQSAAPLDTPPDKRAGVWAAWQRIALLVPRRNGAMASAMRDGRAVLIDSQQLREHELNETSAFLWRHIDGAQTVEDLALAVLGSFPLDPEVVREDLVYFIEEARSVGLITLVDPRRPP